MTSQARALCIFESRGAMQGVHPAEFKQLFSSTLKVYYRRNSSLLPLLGGQHTPELANLVRCTMYKAKMANAFLTTLNKKNAASALHSVIDMPRNVNNALHLFCNRACRSAVDTHN